MGWLEDLLIGAPVASPYVVVSADSTLTHERILAAGTGLDVADGGAGASITMSLKNTAVTPGEYNSARITVDAQGRITAAADGGTGDPWVLLVAASDYSVTAAGPRTVTMLDDKRGAIRPGDPVRWLSSAGVLTRNEIVL